jgi:steroid delta-isomerase-like uncharacterized protein
MEDVMAKDNREKSRGIFEEVWNQKRIEKIDELVSTDYIHHDVLSPDQKGIDAYKQFVYLYRNAFPDIHFKIEDEVSEEDTVVIRWTVTGTHHGDLPGLPRTGRPISVTGITIARLSDGKFVESWNNWDALGMMQQLGGVPTEAKGRAA